MNLFTKIRALSAMPTFGVLLCLSAAHGLNDLLQAVITAVYPMLKADLSLTFAQIGTVTLVYQLSASLFQPVVGWLFDRRPWPWSLPAGMAATTVGIILFSYAWSFTGVLLAVFMVGLGSSTLHPEASRITSLAGRERRGFAQSVFQVGGNIGSSIGPLLVALVVAPHGRRYIIWFLIFSIMAFAVMRPIGGWYRGYLAGLKASRAVNGPQHISLPLSPRRTLFVIVVIMVLIISKYIFMACMTTYLTFFAIDKFGVTISQSQLILFAFVVSTAVGTLVGGPIGDRVGRKPVIWVSILCTAPFSLLLPHVSLPWVVVLSFCSGFMLSSAFPSILLYAQELLPTKLGMISGLFFGFAFGVGGIASAALGDAIDSAGIQAVFQACSFTPLLGVVACLLPNLKGRQLPS